MPLLLAHRANQGRLKTSAEWRDSALSIILCTETLREVCDHHFGMIEAYKTESEIDANDLNRIESRLEGLIQQQRYLFTLLEAEYEQRRAARRKQA